MPAMNINETYLLLGKSTYRNADKLRHLGCFFDRLNRVWYTTNQETAKVAANSIRGIRIKEPEKQPMSVWL